MAFDIHSVLPVPAWVQPPAAPEVVRARVMTPEMDQGNQVAVGDGARPRAVIKYARTASGVTKNALVTSKTAKTLS
jgi:hypothetical protein